jgi:6-pyruvoyltetrahydropterin/6-carboxytetrahydropterin synthase
VGCRRIGPILGLAPKCLDIIAKLDENTTFSGGQSWRFCELLRSIIRLMFRLTREVRFAVNSSPDDQLSRPPANSYGGHPSLLGFGNYLTLQVTLAGPLDRVSGYVVNIKQIDAAVRERAVPLVSRALAARPRSTPEAVVTELFSILRDAWPGRVLESIRLALSPFLAYWITASEQPMVRLSQKFEFSATHRLHNAALSEEENCRIYGKCNNPHGHGHNYELQVTLAGNADQNGVLIDLPAFERIVATSVIDRLDHRNLNVELPEFVDLIPTVENISRIIYGLLKPALADAGARLASITVWETPKTWCEYAE